MKASSYTVYAIHNSEVQYNLLAAKWLTGLEFNFLAHTTVSMGLSTAYDIMWGLLRVCPDIILAVKRVCKPKTLNSIYTHSTVKLSAEGFHC